MRAPTRVLIAEDDPVSGMVLAAALAARGHEVVMTEDGAAAWDAWQAERFPIVISDWMMPGMDGVELCRAIRGAPSASYTYLILLTGKSGKESYIAGMEAGADDFLPKPFDPELLWIRLGVAERILDLQHALLESREALREQATRDALTGIWNRRAILEHLQRELYRMRREGGSVAVVLADLDHFKSVNDVHGHAAGDAVLQEAARRLGGSLRPYDHLGRYGGEEFLLALSGCGAAEGERVANRVRQCLSDGTIAIPGGALHVTASFGVAAAGGDADPAELIAAADRALYRAKNAGRNRVEVEAGNG